MRAYMFDVFQLHPLPRHQRDTDPHKTFVNDVQPALRQQPVNVGDPAIGGVLHRQHRQIRAPLFHRVDGALKRVARDGNHIRPRLQTSLVTIGPQSPLE